MPVAWKIEPPWREGTPADTVPKGPWWRRFDDPVLDRSSSRRSLDNPTLVAGQCAARASARRARIGVVGATAARSARFSRFGRQQISANRPLTNYNVAELRDGPERLRRSRSTSTTSSTSFGRVQRTVEGARATAEQSAADLENTRLLLDRRPRHGLFQPARDRYRARRARALDQVAAARRWSFVSARHELGAASGLDVAQQQALLDTTLTQVDLLPGARAVRARDRDADGHAGADLRAGAGRRARGDPPTIPLGVPSDVLERRPDVAVGRARDGGGECADRRRHRGVLSEHDDRPDLRASRARRWRGCSMRRA